MFTRLVSKRIATAAVLMATMWMAAPQPIAAEGSRYYLRLENVSSFDIHKLFVSSSDEENWGPDQLGVHILRSGASFTLTDISGGQYDVKFVDEDGDSCVVRNVSVYRNKSSEITNQWLLGCEFHENRR
jgi:hypothetical protein